MEPKSRDQPKRRRRGRPTRFTWALAHQICALIEAGATKTDASIALGIPYPTRRLWEIRWPKFEKAVMKAEERRAWAFGARTVPLREIIARISVS